MRSAAIVAAEKPREGILMRDTIDLYERACDSAADAQGITAVVEAMRRRGIEDVWVHQSGGFVMRWIIDCIDGRRFGGTADQAAALPSKEEEEDGQSPEADADLGRNPSPDEIAEVVVGWLAEVTDADRIGLLSKALRDAVVVLKADDCLLSCLDKKYRGTPPVIANCEALLRRIQK
jgi:hypothetical protein